MARGELLREHKRFVEAYRSGEVRLGVVRSAVRASVHDRMLAAQLEGTDYPKWLARLATAFSILVFPCVITAAVGLFFLNWWIAVLGGLLALVFSWLSYRYQRESIRQLVLENPDAYHLLRLHGFIVIDRPSQPKPGLCQNHHAEPAEEGNVRMANQSRQSDQGDENEPVPHLGRWAKEAQKHWQEHRPKMYRELLESKQLIPALLRVQKQVENSLAAGISGGMSDDMAWEVAKDYIYLPSEEEQPSLGTPSRVRPPGPMSPPVAIMTAPPVQNFTCSHVRQHQKESPAFGRATP